MKTYSQISHENLEICSPATWKTYEQILALAPISATPRILDIGCGKCGILANTVDFFKGHGIGVDLGDSLADELTTSAKELISRKKLEIIYQDASAFLNESTQTYDLVICVGSSQALGGLENALKKFGKILKPEGVLLLGEIIWKRNPSANFLSFLGCKKEDLFFSHELHSLVEINDFKIISKEFCSDEDFENYEKNLRDAILNWCAKNPDSEHVEHFKQRSHLWWEARNNWAREEFGFEVILAGKR